MQTKICTKCDEEKLLTQFYFRKDSGKYRDVCIDCWKEATSKIRDKYPWRRPFYSARNRCNNPKSKDYKHYALKKAIKFLLTLEDVKYFWFRDKAYLMSKPSLDRIDPIGIIFMITVDL